jgi:DNA repair exonuclease SbcCD ATPase subunit
MRILRLKLTNFKRHRDLEVEIRPGLIGLTGHNGSGKSSFLSSMAFAITGAPLNDEPLKDLITWGEKNGSVEMEFEHQGMNYTVVRPIGKPGATLDSADGSVSIKGILPVTAEMQRMSGTPFDLFKSIMFVAQDSLDSPLKGTEATRKEAFGKLFNCQRFDRLRDIMQESCSRLQGVANSISESSVENIKKEIEDAEYNLSQVRLQSNQIEGQLSSYDLPALYKVVHSTQRDENALQDAIKRRDEYRQELSTYDPNEISSLNIADLDKDISYLQSVIRYVDTGKCPFCGHTDGKPPISKEEAKSRYRVATESRTRLQNYQRLLRQYEDTDALVTKLSEATVTQEERDIAWKQIKQRETLEQERLRVKSNEGWLEGNLKALNERLREALNKNEEASRAKKLLTDLEAVRSCFHRDALQREIRSYGAKQINDRLLGYLGIFNLPYRPSFDNEGLMKFVDAQTNTEHEFSKLSGGEQKLTALAYRLALMQMFAGNVRVAILDEPTYGVDNQNLATMSESFKALAEYAGQRGLSIFVATHEEALMTSFDQTIQL